MKKIFICVIGVGVILFFSATPLLADEVITEIHRDPCGAYYELVRKDGGVYFRTRLQDHINRWGGRIDAGRRVADIKLRSNLLKLVKEVRKTEIENGYELSISGHVRATVYFENGYAIINVKDAMIDGEKIIK